MLIPSFIIDDQMADASLSRRVNANSQHTIVPNRDAFKLIKKGEC